MSHKKHILLLCDRPAPGANADTIIDHIDSFGKHSQNQVHVWSSTAGFPEELNLDAFDAIVIHYSIPIFSNHYLPDRTAERIRQYRGVKILFVQDEYRKVNRLCDAISRLGIHLIYTNATEDVSRRMYSSILDRGLRFKTTLTGYVSSRLEGHIPKPIVGRPIDVGYRARKCPYWFGRRSMEKYWIGQKFLSHAAQYGLACDISMREKDRLYGEDWIAFLGKCRAVLGTESGASVIDFTGEIEYKTDRFQAFHPRAPFDEVPKELLKTDGEIELLVISPRCFEAAALGTVMVMYPGEYSGILKQDDHYIALEKDHSNMLQVAQKLRDNRLMQAMADRSRHEIIESGEYSYRTFVRSFDSDLDQEIERAGRPLAAGMPSEVFEAIVKRHNARICGARESSFLQCRRRIWFAMPEFLQRVLRVTVLKKRIYG